MSDNELELKKLYWQCRRGMLELDVLLLPFVQEAYSGLSLDDQASFKKLLACEDQDLFAWFMRREDPKDTDLTRIVKVILDRVQPS